MGVISMKKIVTIALAGGALALAACSGETAKAPEEAAATEAPAEAEATATAEEELDPTGNPIGMDAPVAPAEGAAAEAAPAAE
jgi:hypothetical protein